MGADAQLGTMPATELERLAFLGRASRLLFSSLQYRETLQRLSDLAVPTLGDWCAVDMVMPDGTFDRLAVTHRDPAKVAIAQRLWAKHPPLPSDPIGLPQVIRTGQSELAPEILEGVLETVARDEEHLRLIRGLGLRSYVVVPLAARDRVLGGLTLVQAESGRRYDRSVLPFLEEFARLAALAVENAMLFARSEQALAIAQEARTTAEASEEAFRIFVENLPELAWTARPDGHIDYYNRRWYEYTGTTFEEMQGWGWKKVHDPALLPQVTEAWKRSLATGESFEMEFTLRGTDGVQRWFLTRVRPATDASGKIVRWFGTNTNIHELKQAERLSKEVAAQSLETAQALLELRSAKERAERRVAELEARNAGPKA